MTPPNQPAEAPITAESIRTAVQSGNAALRTLISGPENALFNRTVRLNRARDVTQLLPTLQLQVQQRALVLSVTREILQGLLTEVQNDAQNQVGERLDALNRERGEVTAAHQAVLQQQTPAPTPAAQPQDSALPPVLQPIWNAFMRADTTTKAIMVGGALLTFELGRRLWGHLPWWIQTPLAGTGAFLGLHWAWTQFRRWAAVPRVTPQPGSPEATNAPRRVCNVRALGPTTTPPYPGNDRYFAVEGVAAPMTIEQVITRYQTEVTAHPSNRVVLRLTVQGTTMPATTMLTVANRLRNASVRHIELNYSAQ
jgi:hypothetical protein